MSASTRPAYSHLLPFSIPNCSAVQIINELETPLSKGDLTLQLPTVTQQRSADTSTSSAQPILLAFVGTSLFPLFKETTFGTFTQHPRQYGFDFRLSKEATTQVRLILPIDVSEALQDRFEEILIQSGLLLDGIRAAGDEIMRGAKEESKVNAAQIEQGTKEHIKSTPAVTKENELKFSKNVHDNAADIQGAASTVQGYAASASSTVINAAGSAGTAITQAMPNIIGTGTSSDQSEKEDNEEGSSYMGDVKKALEEAASGVAEGTTRVASTVQSSTSQAIEHGYGQEAKSLLESAGNTSADVGKSVGNAAHSTSLLGVGASAAIGAQKEKDDQITKQDDIVSR